VAIVRLAGVLSLIGFSLFFAVRSFEAMLLAMALLAFFWSAALPLVETLTFDHLREQPARYSRIRLWGSIGFIVAVMGTGALLDRLPLSACCG
jgi:PPP family 3-phenylpropionic acid transporter